MGYTHYFEHKKVSKDTWAKIVVDCVKVMHAIDTTFEQEFTDKTITINGIGEEGHETFILERKGSDGFTFCKTARKPYDLFVCACLLIYKHYSSNTMDLSSDGFNKDGTEEDEWVAARDLVKDTLDY